MNKINYIFDTNSKPMFNWVTNKEFLECLKWIDDQDYPKVEKFLQTRIMDNSYKLKLEKYIEWKKAAPSVSVQELYQDGIL